VIRTARITVFVDIEQAEETGSRKGR